MEIYKQYKNTNYEISNIGNLRNKKTKRILKLHINKQGYYCVVVSFGSRKNKKCFKIHRLVAETFIKKINGKLIVNHIDGNKLNNDKNNLEWCTNKENYHHSVKIGLIDIIKRKNCNKDKIKLNTEDIFFIRQKYIPKCKKYGCRALSKKFNVSHTTISRVINNNNYGLIHNV